MKRLAKLPLSRLVSAALALGCALAFAQTSPQSVDVGQQVPDVNAVRDGLFPENACKELEAERLQVHGVQAGHPLLAARLPASSFKVGSAELPELLKQQLDVFADVLRSKRGTGRQVRVIGHADASGTPEVNDTLSVKRAEAVKAYLVQKGADPDMLIVVRQGSKNPVNPANPLGAENRRVEIGRTAP